MDDSLFARLGFDPVAIHTALCGAPPPSGGVVRLRPPAAGNDPAASPEEPPPEAASGEPGSGSEPPPLAGEPSDPPPAGEGDHPRAGGEAPATDPEPPPAPGSDTAETVRAMRAWLDEHWETVEAMVLAGEAPQRPAPPPPEADTPPPPRPPVHVRKGDRWNKPKMAEFLRQLAATHSVSAAARSVGMSRNSAYRLRNRLKGQPFDIAWEAAFRHGYDNLAHAALDRAINGVEVPHYCNGKLVGTSRRYDERLTVALLAMRNRAGAPLLGRYSAAAEYWGERWDALLERVEAGAVDWHDEHAKLGEDELKRLELDEPADEVERLIERNLPDERPTRRAPR